MEILSLGDTGSRVTVVFAAGAGGDPARYRPLLEHLADNDCRVIAPVFERLIPASASLDDYARRPSGLKQAMSAEVDPDTPIALVAHSIGAWAALRLAGGKPSTPDGTVVPVPTDPRVSALVLFAPSAAWFRGPDSLRNMNARTLVLAGELDRVTPISEVELVRAASAEADPRFATTIHQLLVRNLVPVVNGFRAAGITWFVLPRLIQSREEFTLVQDALAAAGVHDVTVVELTVEKDIALQRLQSRDTGANLNSNRDGIAKLHSAPDIASATFATDEMTVEDLAHDVLSHWLSLGD